MTEPMTDEQKAAAAREAVREIQVRLAEIIDPIAAKLLEIAQALGIGSEALEIRDSWQRDNDYRYRIAIWWLYLPVEPEDDIWPDHFPELEPRC